MLSGSEKQQLDFELSSQELVLYGLLVPITNVKVTNKKMYNGVTYKYITKTANMFFFVEWVTFCLEELIRKKNKEIEWWKLTSALLFE